MESRSSTVNAISLTASPCLERCFPYVKSFGSYPDTNENIIYNKNKLSIH